MSRPLEPGERALLEALRGLRFGSVEAVVHEGRILRIERREKVRIEADPDTEGSNRETQTETRKRPERRSSPDIHRGAGS